MKPYDTQTDEPAGEEWQPLGIVQNALRVAGQEMGEGDHWPAIKATLDRLTQDQERYQSELSVSEELKTHIGEILAIFEQAALECDHTLDPDKVAEFCGVVAEMREVYDARFAPAEPASLPDIREIVATHPDFAPYRWAENIIAMLNEGE